jgi:hypothetical protein
MTTATEIMHSARNATEADATARAAMVEAIQDWEHEATLYTFDDDSVLVISGAQLNAFEDLDAAQDALNA